MSRMEAVKQDSDIESRAPARDEAHRMFDRIAHRYDLLNRLLSMRRDVAWRREMAGQLPPGTNLSVLDLATGTGDVLIALQQRCGRIGRGIGLDMSQGMLSHGLAKLRRQGLTPRLCMVRGDAVHLGVAANSVEVVTMAFGIRNVLDVDATLREMLRVLKPGGRALILEFSLPSNLVIRHGYLVYFRHVLPRIGGAISGDSYAYRYLNRTVETFPYGGAFAGLMRAAGFDDVSAIPLTFGIATLYRGDKP
jgi:demethylmenaquinone methyltransferase / 2-methoxy-6-polyprenyl-1,4-benzoquinol methylase